MTKSLNYSLETGFTVGRRSPARKTTSKEKAFTAALRSEAGKSGAAMQKAQKLAAEHGITLTKERNGACWVTCSKFPEGPMDPLDGGHFCVGGTEVLEAVEVYVEALKVSA